MKEIQVSELSVNPIHRIAKDWMLVTAGTKARGYNTMTASWGHLGSIWGHGGGLPTSVIFVRPQRYTYQFTEKQDYFTLTFFAPGEQREALSLCGTKSGRDMDKFAAAGLTPAFADCGAPYAAEGELVLVCRKLYAQNMEEDCFLDQAVMEKCYPEKDYHRMYVGEIVEAYRRV